jgi:hypothetical protein
VDGHNGAVQFLFVAGGAVQFLFVAGVPMAILALSAVRFLLSMVTLTLLTLLVVVIDGHIDSVDPFARRCYTDGHVDTVGCCFPLPIEKSTPVVLLPVSTGLVPVVDRSVVQSACRCLLAYYYRSSLLLYFPLAGSMCWNSADSHDLVHIVVPDHTSSVCKSTPAVHSCT